MAEPEDTRDLDALLLRNLPPDGYEPPGSDLPPPREHRPHPREIGSGTPRDPRRPWHLLLPIALVIGVMAAFLWENLVKPTL